MGRVEFRRMSDAGRTTLSRNHLPDLFARLERFYDAVPRDRAEPLRIGPFTLFVPTGASHPFYARPVLDAPTPTVDDIEAVRAQQRACGLPEAFEWVHELLPDLLPVAERAGLSVLRAPLMVLVTSAPVPPAVPVRLLNPDDMNFASDVATRRAVAHVGFAEPGTAGGWAGPAERDAALARPAPDDVALEARRARAGLTASAIAEDSADGALASGMVQRVGDVAEVVGVATLPQARRRGLGAAVTA